MRRGRLIPRAYQKVFCRGNMSSAKLSQPSSESARKHCTGFKQDEKILGMQCWVWGLDNDFTALLIFTVESPLLDHLRSESTSLCLLVSHSNPANTSGSVPVMIVSVFSCYVITLPENVVPFCFYNNPHFINRSVRRLAKFVWISFPAVHAKYLSQNLWTMRVVCCTNTNEP